jgi:hypothetical protein
MEFLMGSEARGYFLLLLLTVSISAIPLSQLYEAYSRDFYWTNVDMKLPVQAGKNHFEVYVRNELLQRCVEKKRLALMDGDSITPLTLGDFSIRMNRKCETAMGPLAFSVASLTAATIFLALFLRSALKRKKSNDQGS